MLRGIFDGIQRPLETIAKMSDSMFIPKGIDIPPLDHDKTWEYEPVVTWKVGDKVSGGNIIGTVRENNLFKEHRIMVAPQV